MSGQKWGDLPLDVRPSQHHDEDIVGWLLALVVLVTALLVWQGWWG